MKNDLISRQAAIDAIRNAVTKECAEWVVKELPSAQPESSQSVVNDCISRQAAVDTVRKIILGFFSDEDGAMNDTEKTLLSVNKAICNELAKLPSAQPEMLACGEGVLNAQPVGKDTNVPVKDCISRKAAIG